MLQLDSQQFFEKAVTSLQGKRVAVFRHIKPDGDCLGSQVATVRLLLQHGVHAFACNQDLIPDPLRFLLGDTPMEEATALTAPVDAVITVDCATQERMGRSVVKRFPQVFLNIDHHISNTQFAEINIVESAACATAEVLTLLANALSWPLDSLTAQGLYTGIATDTGQFQYAGTTEEVFGLAGQLVAAGADPSEISRQLYSNRLLSSYQLLQRFLCTLQVCGEGRVALGYLKNEDYRQTGCDDADSEGFVDYTRSIKGVLIGVFLYERKSLTKVSIRAELAHFAVHDLASQFGGGGHPCAAGFSVKEPVERFLPKLLEAVEKHLQSVAVTSGTEKKES